MTLRLHLAVLGLVVLLLAGCSSTRVPDYGVILHGEAVPIHVHDGKVSKHVNGDVWIGLGMYRAYRPWVELITHELCHAIDYHAGGPSQAWPGGPTDGWHHRPHEAWADACSWEWREREGNLSFVTPPPRIGIDVSNAPHADAITMSTLEAMCDDEDWRSTCSQLEGTP